MPPHAQCTDGATRLTLGLDTGGEGPCPGVLTGPALLEAVLGFPLQMDGKKRNSACLVKVTTSGSRLHTKLI